MALQSPTTLLNSIQYMKKKLRCDKQTLMDIKNDFTRFSKKQHNNQHDEQEFVLNDITPQIINQQRETANNEEEKVGIKEKERGRVLELKREHQRELARLRMQHAREIQELLRVKNMELQDLDNRWRCKLQEQASYIALLQEQVSSPIQTQRQRVPIEQYDAIINKLLQQNTRLHDSNANLGQQCDRLRRVCSEMNSERTNRSRFRFAKGKEGKASQYVSEHSQSQVAQPLPHHRRVSSVYLYNDQNIDRSNCNEWQDMEIHDEEGGLRTIRQFQKSVLKDNSYKTKADAYLSVKV